MYPDESKIRKEFHTQDEFDILYNYNYVNKKTLFDEILSLLRNYSNRESLDNLMTKIFPFLKCISNYNYKESLSGDIIAGVTVGIVVIPQALSYALLTNVDPVYGLYTSFFAALFYMIFGTSKFISLGPFAIVSLMTGVAANNIVTKLEVIKNTEKVEYLQIHENEHIDLYNFTKMFQNNHENIEKITIVTTLVFFVGMIQIIMGLLRLGFLASYLSDQIVSGFSVGAAVHVCVAQADKLFQIQSKANNESGNILMKTFDIFWNIKDMNKIGGILSLISFIILYIGKDIINPKVKKNFKCIIPFELILILTGTTLSFYFSFNSKYNLEVVDYVPTGFTFAVMPKISLFPYMVGEILEISFVALAIHLSMCKIFSRKLGTKCDNNQELVAIGLTSFLSSFFCVYPVTSALGRSILNVECGAHTQLSALFTVLLILIVILFLAPLLSSLPMCILAVIIIYSTKTVFYKIKELKVLWKISKIDCSIWIVSFISTTFFNLMEGLLISIGYALITTVFRIQWPRWYTLSQLTGTEEYRDTGRYKRVTELNNIVVFRFDAPLLFTNVEHFQNSINKVIWKETNEREENNDVGGNKKNSEKSLSLKITPFNSLSSNKKITQTRGIVNYLIVDCSGFTFIDITSITSLIDLFHRLGKIGVTTYFAGAKAPIRDILERANFFETVPKKFFFPTIHDAVLAAGNTFSYKYSLSFPPPSASKRSKKKVVFFEKELEEQNISNIEPLSIDSVLYELYESDTN
uniref:Cation efflux protein cytoplasmic domain-containing protein n=1 Tax=Strongyloides stercoralis TaxID=6248 RepID=A0A0K0E0P8_STRER